MAFSPELYWLPIPPGDWRLRLKALAEGSADKGAWDEAVRLANYRLNFPLTNALGAVVTRLFHHPPGFLQTAPERLAILSSSTTTHLLHGLRVGALRRGLWMGTYENEYGQYRQELFDDAPGLRAFSPTAVLFCLDANHVAAGVGDCRTSDQATKYLERFGEGLIDLWRVALDRFDAKVFQQTIVPRLLPVLGSNEHRHPGSASAFIGMANAKLRECADTAGVDLLALDAWITRSGLSAWHSPSFWLQAKQEIHASASPVYGDLVARLIAAKHGRAAKCCVFDLDNTLWGGVVGDDGIEGLVVGHGSAAGEAFLGVQSYAAELRRRGIVLAVCSKNDEKTAASVFEGLPDMLLKRSDFACFVANWNDKATNLRAIVDQLNLGLDALVFVDDNPAERELIRRELPQVLVPELPVEPELFAACIADAGYFEGVAVTSEDLARADLYRARERVMEGLSSTTDLSAYLAELEMTLVWGVVDEPTFRRSLQLLNKTNQFNLTAERYSESQLRVLMTSPDWLCLQLRLVDRFGDNGIIAVVLGQLTEGKTFELKTWVMSCRVLGRTVEEATLNVVAELAGQLGALELLGIYRPTERNEMVREHYERLGFSILSRHDNQTTSALDLASFRPRQTAIRTTKASP